MAHTLSAGSRRTGWVSSIAAALVVAAVVSVAPPAPVEANTLVVDTLRPDPGPLGPITVIGDSVLLGSGLVSPGLDDTLAARGWGPVRFRASVGMSTGAPGTGRDTTAAYWIERWRRDGWNTRDIIVNVGANDSGICDADLACARARIERLLVAIGPGHQIWWPKVTRHPTYAHQAAAWNTALDEVAATRDDLVVWDWPTVMYAEGQYEWDHTHLTAAGYRRRNELIAGEVTADLARGTRTGTDAALPAATGPPSALVPIGPVRALDTRTGAPGRFGAATTHEVDLSAHVPAGATAVAVYVTAVDPADRGYITAWDCTGTRPTASTVNYPAAANRGAVALAPLSPGGSLCLFTRAATDVVIDLQAAFVPVPATGLRFTPLAVPERLLDTRESGRDRLISVGVPAGADAVAVSIAAIGRGAQGFVTAYGCTPTVPTIATVNHGAAEIVAGTAFVPVGDGGRICLYVRSGADVTVDLTGTFAADGDLVFVPVVPTRTIDTRDRDLGWAPIHGRGQTVDARVAPAGAAAVSGTLTIVEPLRPGHLRAHACTDLPATANVNAAAGAVLANSVTTAIDTAGNLCVWARAATQTVFDTTGWWLPTPHSPLPDAAAPRDRLTG